MSLHSGVKGHNHNNIVPARLQLLGSERRPMLGMPVLAFHCSRPR